MMVKVPISLMEDLTKQLDKVSDILEDIIPTGEVSWSTVNQTRKLSKLIKDNYTEIKT